MKLSITGADNNVNIDELKKAVEKYPFLELALLYFPEKENQPRNPGLNWRKEYLEKIPYENRAIHLCGHDVFISILDNNFKQTELFSELKKYNRIQININARKNIFTIDEIYDVYNVLLKNDFHLIFQYHEQSHFWLNGFLTTTKYENFDILIDSSKGRGISPEFFDIPDLLKERNYNIGFAGGLSEKNIAYFHNQIKSFNLDKYWLDLESGVRTDNLFDIEKLNKICYNFGL